MLALAVSQVRKSCRVLKNLGADMALMVLQDVDDFKKYYTFNSTLDNKYAG